jgi:GTP-binding protein EngB required for normal cell division
MTGLSDNYKRRILTSLQYADKLLQENLNAMAPGARPLFSGYVQDLSPDEARCVESYTRKIREQMGRLMDNCGIERSSPATPSRGKIRTGLTSVDLTLEDIYPEKMRGYGKVDSASARNLTWNLQEIRRLISLLLSYMSESRMAGTREPVPANLDPALAALLERIGQIIADHGLIEFLPAFNMVFRQISTHRFEIAVFGKANTGRASFINRLLEIDLLPVGAARINAVPVHIMPGADTRIRVTYLDKTEECPPAALARFVTEDENSANSRRVVALEAFVDSRRLQEGYAFIDVPGIGCFPPDAGKFSPAYLPVADFALVLVDGQAEPSREELDLLRALRTADMPSAVIISRCDQLNPAQIERARAHIQSAIAKELGSCPDIILLSASASWAPALNAWFEGKFPPLLAQSRSTRLSLIERNLRSMRSSLLTTLACKAAGAPAGERMPPEVEDILRRIDECLAAFQQHWEREFDRITGWAGDILERMASSLAIASTATDRVGGLPPGLAAKAMAMAVVIQYQLFLKEYGDLTDRVDADLRQLIDDIHVEGAMLQELPHPTALPAASTSTLADTIISIPAALVRANQASRARHFRKELDEKVAPRLRLILEEFQPRLRHWFLKSMNELKENIRRQTDPLRFRSPSRESSDSDESIAADIAFLRGE